VTQSQLETDVYAWVQKAKFLNDAMDILEISVGQCLNTAPVQPAYPAYPGAAYNPGYGGTPTTGSPNIYGAGADFVEGANTVEGAGASFKSDKASGFSGIGYGNFYSYGPDCSALLSQLTRLQDQLCAAEFYLSQLIEASIQGTKDRNDIMLSCKDESTPGKVCPRECSDVSDCRECGKTCDLRSGSRDKNKCVKRVSCPNTCTNDDSCSICGKTKCSGQGQSRKCS
jgi:hypothetical protein